MQRTRLLLLAGLFGLELCMAPPAAALPPDRTETYYIHTDPEDPESDVKWRIDLELHAMSVSGSTIEWRVDRIKLAEVGASGQDTRRWNKFLPNVETQSGYWSVVHANVNQPVSGEFAEPPLIDQQLTATYGGSTNLNLQFEGQPYTPPPGGAPWDGRVAAVDYSFALVGGGGPLDEDENADAETLGEEETT